MHIDRPVRVRFAPSPTGFLHIGNAHTALFNWLFARHHKGTFILRIDDTDEARSSEESMGGIYESLKWLGLDWDEGPHAGGSHAPYVQSERGDLYRSYLQRLLDSGDAYHCYCTPDELAEMREKARADRRPPRYDGRHRNLTEAERRKFEAEGRRPVVRLKIPDGRIVVNDLVLDDVKFEADTLDDFIIVKSNGSPLYNFTSIIDDVEMGVTHVIRGVDHLANTPKQILICQALGLTPPPFAHLPMVLGSSKGERLSKRHGATSVEQYRLDGYLPEALVNFLVRLGWSYDDKEEIFSVAELIDRFDLDRVGKSGGVFDIKKLQWLNGHYIMKQDLPARTKAVIPFLQQDGFLDAESPPARGAWLEKIVEAVGDRLTTLADISTYTSFFFTDDLAYDPKAVKKWWRKANTVDILQGLRDVLVSIDDFDRKPIENEIWAYLDGKEIKRIQGMQPLRIALTGKSVGPGLFEIIQLLGQKQVVERLDRAIAYLQATAE